MAIYRNGSKGEAVKKLQRALQDAGIDPGPIDGVFGPLTETAVRNYQTSQGWTPTGAVGKRMLKSLGLNTTGGGDEPSDYTTNEDTRFNGLPGKPEIWYNTETDTWSVVYFAPGIEPPLPIMFTVSSEADLKSFFGDKTPVADHEFTTKQMNRAGAITFGTSDTIPEKDGDMWAGFTERMERARKTQPWLEDPEVFSIFAGAWVEGRQPERWELEATGWWQTHNEAQREWMWLAARDPSQAEEVWESNYISIFNQFKEIGMTDIPDDLLEYMTGQFTQGNWSRNYLQEQTAGLAGGATAKNLDKGLRKFLRGNNIDLTKPSTGEGQVRDLYETWLGPAFPPTDKQLQRWAARFRDNPQEAQADLENKLRSQRKALFPEYEDDNMTYDDIASPWRSVMARMWGGTPDETDPTFTQMLKNNNSVQNEELLRKVGIKRGNSNVERDLIEGLYSTIGGARNPV